MKLFYLHPSRMPTEKAHGIQITEMCKAFSDQGVEVHLIVPDVDGSEPKQVFEFYGIDESFYTHKIHIQHGIINILKVISAKMAFIFQLLLFYWVARSYFRREVKKEKVCIYTRSLFARIFFSTAVIELHQLPSHIGRWHRWLFNRAPVIVLTQLMKDELVLFGLSEENILVSPDGVSLDQFINFEKKKVSSFLMQQKKLGKKIVLYTGSFFRYKWKGVQILLEAALLLPKEEYIVVLIGAMTEEKKELDKKYKDESNLYIMEHVPHQDIPSYLCSADVLVLPNTSDGVHGARHTSPLKLFEYMASGIPLVVTDVPAIQEIISEDYAWVAKEGDSISLAEKIQEATEKKQISKQKVVNTLTLVKKYTWNERAKNILTFLYE